MSKLSVANASVSNVLREARTRDAASLAGLMAYADEITVMGDTAEDALRTVFALLATGPKVRS